MSARHEESVARFDKLYRTTRADILSYLLRRVSSPEDAADALAETYLIAWEKLDSIPSGGQAELWLFGVARNVLLRGIERRHGNNALVERIATELRNDRYVQPSDDPQLLRLRAALGSLPAIDREILTLAAWEELAPRQIATVLNISPNTVRIRLHRARRHVRQRLEVATPPDPPPHAALLNARN